MTVVCDSVVLVTQACVMLLDANSKVDGQRIDRERVSCFEIVALARKEKISSMVIYCTHVVAGKRRKTFSVSLRSGHINR